AIPPRTAPRRRRRAGAGYARSWLAPRPAGALAAPDRDQHEHGQEHRHQRDVDDLEHDAESLDVAVEPALHRAQLLAELGTPVDEAVDLGPLLGSHEDVAAILARCLQLGQPALGLLELLLEPPLGLLESRLCLGAQRLDPRER